MPRNYKYKRSARRNNYVSSSNARRRKYVNKKRKTISYTQKAVGPPSMIRKLRYADRISIDPGASGVATTHSFVANGLFDPDLTGTGHQPMGFDQLMPLYDHYKVIGSKITVQFLGPNGSSPASTDQVIACIYLDDDDTAVSSILPLIENGNCAYTLLNNGHNPSKKLTKGFSSKRFFASKKYSAELTGTTSTNPTEVANYKICVQALDAASDPSEVDMLVTIDYIVQFSERKTLAQS